MAATNYTPIQLYNSGTTGNAPSAGNLAAGELAINYTDGKLFYKDNSAAVQVIAWKTTPTTAGGTGLTSYTAGDLPYYASGTALSKLAIGSANYVLTSSGSAPQYVAQSTLSVGSATNATNTATTDDTSTNATMYPVWKTSTSGNLTEYVSSTKFKFNPSTGTLSATVFSGSGASLTSIPNSALTNSSVTFNSTTVALGSSGTIPGIAQAWAQWNASGTIAASYNVSSVTVSSTAIYVVNFTNSLTDNKYAVAGSANINNGTNNPIFSFSAPTTSSVTVYTLNPVGGAVGYSYNCVVIFR